MSYKHITTHECCYIVNFIELGWSLRKIANHPSRNISTISREISRNRIKAHHHKLCLTVYLYLTKYLVKGDDYDCVALGALN